MLHMKNVGKRLRFAREKRQFSQEYLAEVVGISPVHLSRIENGHVIPKTDILAKLSRELNYSADFFLFGEEKTDNKLIALFENQIRGYEEKELQMIIGIMELVVAYLEGEKRRNYL